MDLDTKLTKLEAIYALHQESGAGAGDACTTGCSDCCTRNVTATTLEGYLLARRLLESGNAALFEEIREASGNERFVPKMTTNGLARYCMENREPPEEVPAPTGPRCPLLAETLCRFYSHRPLGCRCMVSRRRCAETGAADMDDLTVTVHTVLLQVVEHLDADGCTGNLVDVLGVMAAETNRNRYRDGRLACDAAGLVSNQAIPVLMIPPAHRDPIQPILERLHAILRRKIYP